MATEFEGLLRLVDQLEAETDGYVTLDVVCAGLGADAASLVQRAIDVGVLLIDHRWRLTEGAALPVAVTVCRLNRQHPLVRDSR